MKTEQTITLKADMEQIDLNQIKACIRDNPVLVDEFNKLRKTANNIYHFVRHHNLGFLDGDEFLSHDREYCFFRLYF